MVWGDGGHLHLRVTICLKACRHPTLCPLSSPFPTPPSYLPLEQTCPNPFCGQSPPKLSTQTQHRACRGISTPVSMFPLPVCLLCASLPTSLWREGVWAQMCFILPKVLLSGSKNAYNLFWFSTTSKYYSFMPWDKHWIEDVPWVWGQGHVRIISLFWIKYIFRVIKANKNI